MGWPPGGAAGGEDTEGEAAGGTGGGTGGYKKAELRANPNIRSGICEGSPFTTCGWLKNVTLGPGFWPHSPYCALPQHQTVPASNWRDVK
jgi:hypothetical protein